MNDDPFSADETPVQPQPTPPVPAARPESAARKWAARIGIGALTAVALGVPVLFGLVFYLALSDGITINGGDPIHEARLWMIRERRGLTGLAWSVATPNRAAVADPGDAANIQCARTRVRYLKWDAGLRFEPDSDYCQCFEVQAGEWSIAGAQCQVE